MIRVLAFLAGLLWASSAFAQAVPSGVFVPGHTVRCQNSTCTVFTDAGGSAGSSLIGQNYLTEIGITNTGTPLCVNDALISSPVGYHALCFGANSLGGGLISYNGYGIAGPLPLVFNINGVNYPFPGSGSGTVVGPPSSTTGYAPLWSGTGGMVLSAGLPVATTGNSTIIETNSSGLLATSLLPKASSSQFGLVEVDGTTLVANSGVLSAGTIPNVNLTNSSITIAGHSVALGGTQTIACADLSTGATGCSTAVGTIATQNANNVSITGGAITGMPTPVAATDVAIKSYVDSVSSGLVVHASVVVATAAALPTNTYNNGTSGVGATLTATSNGALTVDGVLMTTTTRVLVKNEAAPANNGCYTVTTVGDGSNPYVLTRCTDFNQTSNITTGSYFFATSGTANTNTGWIMTTTGSITPGTTAVVFSQFSSSTAYTAGSGLTLSGSAFSLTSPVTTAHGGLGAANGSASGVPVFASGTATVTATTGTGSPVLAKNPTLTSTTTTPALTLSTPGAANQLEMDAATGQNNFLQYKVNGSYLWELGSNAAVANNFQIYDITNNTPAFAINTGGGMGIGESGKPLTTPSPFEIGSGKPWADVTYFGAIGDGSTDNVTAFNNARTVANAINGPIFVPAGFFCVGANGGFNLTGVTELLGAGWRAASIGACGYDVTPLTVSNGDNRVQDLQIVGKGAFGDPGETTFGASTPALHVASSAGADNLLDHLYVVGGSNAILNDAPETVIDFVFTEQSYGPAFYSNGGGWYRKAKLDHQWGAGCGAPNAGYNIQPWAGFHTYGNCEVATIASGAWMIQVVSPGTTGGSMPALTSSAENYGHNFPTDGSVIWQLLGPVGGAAAWINTGASENYFLMSDFTGAYTYGLVATGTSNVKCVECVMSQTIGETLVITGGSADVFIENSTIGCAVLANCGAVFIDSNTAEISIIGGVLSGPYGVIVNSNASSFIIDGVILKGSTAGVAINAGDNHFVVNNNVCGGYGGIQDFSGAVSKIVQSTCP